MTRPMKAFEVTNGGRTLDYRIGKTLSLSRVRSFFGTRYEVNRLWNGGRHVLGELRKNGRELFLKLATTEGISVLTRNEYRWNDVFNGDVRNHDKFRVPVNYEEGIYEGLYYLVTDTFAGTRFAPGPEKGTLNPAFVRRIPDVIAFTEHIRTLPHDEVRGHTRLFLVKTRAWYDAIPESVRNTQSVQDLLHIAEDGAGDLASQPRHGDFAPWHLMDLPGGMLGLIDGEHYLSNGVEDYDLGYLMQRLYAVLGEAAVVSDVYADLRRRGYRRKSLRTVLAARAIGGFLDASLDPNSGYDASRAFARWVVKL